MLRRMIAPIAALALLPLLVTPSLAAGAYVGVGPSEVSGSNTVCDDDVALVLSPSPLRAGLWAVDIACAYAWPYNTYSGVGARHFPSHVANELEGSPETGFTDSGTANVWGTTPGRIDWSLAIGPLGEGTAWSLDTVFTPDHDPAPRSSWWRGTADFVGASS